MNLKFPEWKSWALFGAVVGGAAYGAQWLIKALHIPILKWGLEAGKYTAGGTFSTIDVPVRATITSMAAWPDAADKFLDMMKGYLGTFALPDMLAVVISAMVFTFLGAWIYKALPLFGKGKEWKVLVGSVFYGLVLATLLTTVFTGFAMAGAFVALLLYSAIIVGIIYLVKYVMKMVIHKEWPEAPRLN